MVDHGGPATPADLARFEGARPQSMRAVVAVLEKLKLFRRRPHPTDGRQVFIELTSGGAALRKTADDAGQKWLARAVSRLDRHDRATLFTATEIIQRLLED